MPLARVLNVFRRSHESGLLIAATICVVMGSEPQEAHAKRIKLAVPAANSASPTARAAAAPNVAQAPTLTTAPFPLSQTFKLHSRSSATKRVYLDFDGHVTQGTPWNSTAEPKIWTTAYSLDTSSFAFNDQELTQIQLMWQMVANAFSPFDVDVTTEDTPASDLINGANTNAKWGMRVLVGVSVPSPAPGAGGVAFLNSFGENNGTGIDTPCYAFSDAQGNDSFVIALTCIHEVGHTLGLSHDGAIPNTGYYGGHGTGPTGWGPFMGAGFNQQLQQWSKGEYVNANNFEDDLAIITTTPTNGFTYRVDDFGNSAATAKIVVGGTTDGAVPINQAGCIEQNTDTDWFKVVARSAGKLTLNATTSPNMTMLDIQMDIYREDGSLLTSVNPINDVVASTSLPIAAGTYYIKIDGVGARDLATGYTDYGSLGLYYLTGSYTPNSTTGATTKVIASFNNTTKTLTVTGDSGANSLVIIRDGNNLKIEGGVGTSINNKPSDLFALPSGTTTISLDVNLKAGDDLLTVSNTKLLNAKIEMGDGKDNCSIKNSPASTITINTDTAAANVAGKDTVLVEKSNVTTSLSINLGAFDDSLSISSSIIGNLSLQMGSGNDSSTLSYNTFRNINVDGGIGTDTLIRTTSTVSGTATVVNVP